MIQQTQFWTYTQRKLNQYHREISAVLNSTASLSTTAQIHNQLEVTNKYSVPEVTLDNWEKLNSQNNCLSLLAPQGG